MHSNDLKCGDIVDFCYITKSFCSMKVSFLEGEGGWGWGYDGANFGPLVQKIRIWAVMNSNGHNITRNGFYDLLNP